MYTIFIYTPKQHQLLIKHLYVNHVIIIEGLELILILPISFVLRLCQTISWLGSDHTFWTEPLTCLCAAVSYFENRLGMSGESSFGDAKRMSTFAGFKLAPTTRL